MKIALLQPYLFPYIGYISLVKHIESLILFDSIQFMKGGWINRNRILKPNEGWQYFTIPLAQHKMTTLIKDIRISNNIDWRNRIIRQIEHYKFKAPYYKETRMLVENVLSIDTDNIAKLNKYALKVTCDYIGINFQGKLLSEMNLEIDKVNAPDEWALNVCKALKNVTEYWNPPGGMEFYDRLKYKQQGIELYFHKVNFTQYNQYRSTFESGLSIIDVMMFNSPEQIRVMLDSYELL